MAALAVGPVAIVGLGVIGGSLARALVRQDVPVRAYATSVTDVVAARRVGIDVAPDLRTCLSEASAVLIAVPLSTHAAVAAEVADLAPPSATLLHAASLQSSSALARAAERETPFHADLGRRVVGTHPIAGSHRAGFGAASADLFEGCVVSVEDRADARTREVAEALWHAVGARRVEYRTADDHDRLMTWVSHLPQLASTALAHAIAGAGVPSEALGPGGRDATRLAASSFEMWSGILAASSFEAAQAVAALERSAGELRSALESSDMRAVERMWVAARSWREVVHTEVDATERGAEQ